MGRHRYTQLRCVALISVATVVVAVAVSGADSALAAPREEREVHATSDRATDFLDCSQGGGTPLGTSYTDSRVTVPTCGPLPRRHGDTGPTVYAYPKSRTFEGYQCVQFSERYLFYRYGFTMPISTSGAQVVDHYASRYSNTEVLTGGTAATAPAVGDVVSFADATVGGNGHTGVIIAATIDSSGDGSVDMAEQNFRGGTGPLGHSVIAVKDWRIVLKSFDSKNFSGAKWLRVVSAKVAVADPSSYVIYNNGPSREWGFASSDGDIRCSVTFNRGYDSWGCVALRRTFSNVQLPPANPYACRKPTAPPGPGGLFGDTWDGGFTRYCADESWLVKDQFKSLPTAVTLTVDGIACQITVAAAGQQASCSGPGGAKFSISRRSVSWSEGS